jgi:hypothetical protein
VVVKCFASEFVQPPGRSILRELTVPHGRVVLGEPLSKPRQFPLGKPPYGAGDLIDGGHEKSLLLFIRVRNRLSVAIANATTRHFCAAAGAFTWFFPPSDRIVLDHLETFRAEAARARIVGDALALERPAGVAPVAPRGARDREDAPAGDDRAGRRRPPHPEPPWSADNAKAVTEKRTVSDKASSVAWFLEASLDNTGSYLGS